MVRSIFLGTCLATTISLVGIDTVLAQVQPADPNSADSQAKPLIPHNTTLPKECMKLHHTPETIAACRTAINTVKQQQSQ